MTSLASPLVSVWSRRNGMLYDSATKTIYQLDDQKKPEQFAGKMVTVSGDLDAASKTIHIANIKAAS